MFQIMKNMVLKGYKCVPNVCQQVESCMYEFGILLGIWQLNIVKDF